MMKGGYALINCKGLDLKVASGQTIAGLYDNVVTAMKRGKTIIANNLMWGTDPISPVAVFANFDGTDNYVVCTASTLQIIVAKNNAVTINNMAPTANRTTTAKTSK